MAGRLFVLTVSGDDLAPERYEIMASDLENAKIEAVSRYVRQHQLDFIGGPPLEIKFKNPDA
jgi:hypothetical protein